MVERSLQQPCEEVMWHVLPFIRAGLAKELGKLGLTQQRIAEELGLTQAAVSQYINGKRARTAKPDEHTSQLLENLARDIRDEEVVNFTRRICKVCNHINDNEELLENCGVEREGVKEASAS